MVVVARGPPPTDRGIISSVATHQSPPSRRIALRHIGGAADGAERSLEHGSRRCQSEHLGGALAPSGAKRACGRRAPLGKEYEAATEAAIKADASAAAAAAIKAVLQDGRSPSDAAAVVMAAIRSHAPVSTHQKLMRTGSAPSASVLASKPKLPSTESVKSLSVPVEGSHEMGHSDESVSERLASMMDSSTDPQPLVDSGSQGRQRKIPATKLKLQVVSGSQKGMGKPTRRGASSAVASSASNTREAHAAAAKGLASERAPSRRPSSTALRGLASERSCVRPATTEMGMHPASSTLSASQSAPTAEPPPTSTRTIPVRPPEVPRLDLRGIFPIQRGVVKPQQPPPRKAVRPPPWVEQPHCVVIPGHDSQINALRAYAATFDP